MRRFADRIKTILLLESGWTYDEVAEALFLVDVRFIGWCVGNKLHRSRFLVACSCLDVGCRRVAELYGQKQFGRSASDRQLVTYASQEQRLPIDVKYFDLGITLAEIARAS